MTIHRWNGNCPVRKLRCTTQDECKANGLCRLEPKPHTGRVITRVALTQAEIQRRRRHGTQALRDVVRESYGPLTDQLGWEQLELFK